MSKAPPSGLHTVFCARVENTLKTHINCIGTVKAETRNTLEGHNLKIVYSDMLSDFTLVYHIPDKIAESLQPNVVNHVAHAFYQELCKRNGWPITWEGE